MFIQNQKVIADSLKFKNGSVDYLIISSVYRKAILKLIADFSANRLLQNIKSIGAEKFSTFKEARVLFERVLDLQKGLDKDIQMRASFLKEATDELKGCRIILNKSFPFAKYVIAIWNETDKLIRSYAIEKYPQQVELFRLPVDNMPLKQVQKKKLIPGAISPETICDKISAATKSGMSAEEAVNNLVAVIKGAIKKNIEFLEIPDKIDFIRTYTLKMVEAKRSLVGLSHEYTSFGTKVFSHIEQDLRKELNRFTPQKTDAFTKPIRKYSANNVDSVVKSIVKAGGEDGLRFLDGIQNKRVILEKRRNKIKTKLDDLDKGIIRSNLIKELHIIERELSVLPIVQVKILEIAETKQWSLTDSIESLKKTKMWDQFIRSTAKGSFR